MCKFCLFTVPSPVVEVTNIDSVEFGETTTLECNVIAVRGITSKVHIFWFDIYAYYILRRVEDVTANIVNNSAVYTDQLVTPPLNVSDNGRLYICTVTINATIEVSSYGILVLNFTGKQHYKYLRNMYSHIRYGYTYLYCYWKDF